MAVSLEYIKLSQNTTDFSTFLAYAIHGNTISEIDPFTFKQS